MEVGRERILNNDACVRKLDEHASVGLKCLLGCDSRRLHVTPVTPGELVYTVLSRSR